VIAARTSSLAIAIVGPHGHGKTMLAASLLRLSPPPPSRHVSHPTQALVAGSERRFRGPQWQASRGVSRDVNDTPDTRLLARALGYDESSIAVITLRATPFRVATDRRVYTFFDCPGVPRLARRNTFSILGSMDAIVVVVSPFELGTTEEAFLRELSAVARHVGGRAGRALVLLNKADHLGSQAEADEVCSATEARIRPLLAEAGYADEDVVFLRGAAGPAAAGDERFADLALRVRGVLDAWPSPPRFPDLPLLLPTFRAFPITGRGTAATGVVARGRVRPGDLVRVVGARRSPYGREIDGTEVDAKVLSVRSFADALDVAEAGDAVGILVASTSASARRRPGGIWVNPYEVSHGTTVLRHGDDVATSRFTARLRFLGTADVTFGPHARYLFHAGMARETGRLELEGRAGGRSQPGGRSGHETRIRGGDVVTAAVVLETPMFVEPGMRFYARTDRIVALGEIVSMVT